MQVLSRLLLLIGLIVLVAGLVLLGKNVIDINQLHAVAYANKSNEGPNPNQQILLMAGLTSVGGFLTGLGLSMPRR
ncbi:hypothetical protein ACFSR9_01005 [Deinococcus taklimakanensis]|uniref:DUF3185 family protein n=1 Tax=Deinococcus taklimakanensis TaxID=536443 RepID=A0ABW5NZ02_9DEIO